MAADRGGSGTFSENFGGLDGTVVERRSALGEGERRAEVCAEESGRPESVGAGDEPTGGGDAMEEGVGVARRVGSTYQRAGAARDGPQVTKRGARAGGRCRRDLPRSGLFVRFIYQVNLSKFQRLLMESARRAARLRSWRSSCGCNGRRRRKSRASSSFRKRDSARFAAAVPGNCAEI